MKFKVEVGVLFAILLASASASGAKSDPIQGKVETNQRYTPEYQPPATYASYPVFTPPAKKPTAPPKPPEKKPEPPRKLQLNASAQQAQQQPAAKLPPKPPIKATIVAGVLPAEFLGQWQVFGSRKNMSSAPQYQGEVGKIFSVTTSNVWTIQGSPQQGYTLTTDSGVTTGLTVRSSGNQAELCYEHPIRNTVARERIVVTASPGGASFSGNETISILKKDENGPRAVVTYQLSGRRTR